MFYGYYVMKGMFCFVFVMEDLLFKYIESEYFVEKFGYCVNLVVIYRVFKYEFDELYKMDSKVYFKLFCKVIFYRCFVVFD